MNSLMPIAVQMLEKHGEFYPFGGVIKTDDTILHLSAADETDHPPSEAVIEILETDFRQGAQDGTYRATALISDVKITPPRLRTKTDAIQVMLDHRDSYAVVVFFPYKLRNGKVAFRETFAQEGSYRIFGTAV